ncbi:MAG: hypothetical protein WDW36_010337 [Sanguina aurantia]
MYARKLRLTLEGQLNQLNHELRNKRDKRNWAESPFSPFLPSLNRSKLVLQAVIANTRRAIESTPTLRNVAGGGSNDGGEMRRQLQQHAAEQDADWRDGVVDTPEQYGDTVVAVRRPLRPAQRPLVLRRAAGPNGVGSGGGGGGGDGRAGGIGTTQSGSTLRQQQRSGGGGGTEVGSGGVGAGPGPGTYPAGSASSHLGRRAAGKIVRANRDSGQPASGAENMGQGVPSGNITGANGGVGEAVDRRDGSGGGRGNSRGGRAATGAGGRSGRAGGSGRGNSGGSQRWS